MQVSIHGEMLVLIHTQGRRSLVSDDHRPLAAVKYVHAVRVQPVLAPLVFLPLFYSPGLYLLRWCTLNSGRVFACQCVDQHDSLLWKQKCSGI